MIALVSREDPGGILRFDIDGDSVNVVAACAQAEDAGAIDCASMSVTLDDAEAWLSRMLDCVRKAKAVKP